MRRGLTILCLLSAAFLAIRLIFAFVEPSYSFVDDLTYASAAIHMALGEKYAAVAQNACNYEHPPLAKLLTALSFDTFGKTQVIGANVGVGVNQLGGRFFQIVMASLMAPLTYLIVNRVSKNREMALLAGIFVLVDPLLFTLSLTAGIDVAMVFFGELALVPYVYRTKIGRLNSQIITGFILGLSLLSKETAVFIVFAIVTYDLLQGSGDMKARLASSGQILVGAAVVFVLGLQAYDSLLTPFLTFVDHLQVMISYHFGAGPSQLAYLANGSNCLQYSGLCPTDRSLIPHFLYAGLPLGFIQNTACTACWAATNPLDWLTYFPPVAFPTALVLAPNYPLVWMAFVWVPIGMLALVRRRINDAVKPTILASSILLWDLASNLWLYEGVGRAVFEWYLLPAVPAFAMGGAYLLTRNWMPRPIRYAAAASVIVVGLLLSPAAYHLIYPAPQYCSSC